MGRLLAILGVNLTIFFYVAFFCYVYYRGLLFHVWDGVGVGLFFSCDKYLY